MAGIFNDEITANRDLTRQFEYQTDDSTPVPISLEAYTRLIYVMQTDEAVPIEILTVDSAINPEYLFIDGDPADGVIKLEVPGTVLEWQSSDSGRWHHEMILLDNNGGILEFFAGGFIYKKPTVIITP